ncbi:MAG: hypothetical protein K8R87_09310 [Verrucomicrobia bacterium]|nr:hypothetical protein [Verrucomicrobiota bacterium]
MISKSYFAGLSCAILVAAQLAVADPPPRTASTQTAPDTNVLLPLKKIGAQLTVVTPPGLNQVTLECKSGNGWKPLAVSYVTEKKKSHEARIFFPPPTGYALSQLRARACVAKFPARFTSGPNSFSRASIPPWFIPGPIPPIAVLATGNTTASVSDAGKLAVVEPDIWKVIGSQLFFFNQYRGLQVFDIANGQSPVRTGTLRLPASGEQFFALDSTGSYLALLGRDQSAAADSNNPYAVFVLSVTAGVPTLVTKLPIQGHATDSRLIGTRLYVASTVRAGTNGSWSTRTVLQGFELSNPQQPVTFTPLTLSPQVVLSGTDPLPMRGRLG